jgi:hypothetical protein
LGDVANSGGAKEVEGRAESMKILRYERREMKQHTAESGQWAVTGY